ncbi:hypothetical protein M5X11_21205 [Paenibacillus alginolyticus]|uniref:hypothetical protein n=1 Tax=Paenibacillus alginolyticus TaxID=59839 RepID=UPI0004235364|nr:hypothetical protein [Paenibacillus alginolyticus]MCY9667410.1 hypothetical protein [Paenibacillus alginolyticus]
MKHRKPVPLKKRSDKGFEKLHSHFNELDFLYDKSGVQDKDQQQQNKASTKKK